VTRPRYRSSKSQLTIFDVVSNIIQCIPDRFAEAHHYLTSPSVPLVLLVAIMPRRVARRTIGLDGRFPRLCRRMTTTRMTIEQYRRIRGEIDGRAYPSRARAYSLSLCLFLLIQRSRTILYPLYPREMMQAKIVGHAPPFDDTIYPDIYRAPVKLKTRERSLTLIFRSCDTNWVVARG